MIQEKEYLSVKDVAEMLDTEAYVLRFYEKELSLKIKRNSKGHRIYTLEDVSMFRKIQEMREQGLQLKAIENIVHDCSSEEEKETYEQLSGISISGHAMTPLKKGENRPIDITNAEDEKVKQFSELVKDMLKQALTEYHKENNVLMQEAIKQEIDRVVDDKLNELEEKQSSKTEEYYRKLDEAMREVQKMRKQIFESQEEVVKIENKKEKTSFWSRLFKDKHQATQI